MAEEKLKETIENYMSMHFSLTHNLSTTYSKHVDGFLSVLDWVWHVKTKIGKTVYFLKVFTSLIQ